MQKVIINLSVYFPIYDISPGKSASEIAANSGVTDPALYLEFSDSDFDSACYIYPSAFSLSGGVISFSLPLAKLQATNYEKANYSTLESQATNNYTVTQLSSQASLPTVSRLPAIQSVLDAVNVLAVELSDKLTAISLSVDINELNNIVNPPTPLSVTSGSITGTAQVGSTLTYTPGVASGGVAPITTSWIWKRGLTTVGTTSSTTYVPVADDVGSVITVVITATDYTLNTASATTAPTAAVTYSSTTFNVTNNGSGNYVINGASNPTLTLAGGITYTFNISAPGHPFWIKTTQTTGTANIYNTGVTNNGTDNGVITFVVPSTGVPSQLYYNCQYHASMAGVLNMLP